jgi:hypothetical protein
MKNDIRKTKIVWKLRSLFNIVMQFFPSCKFLFLTILFITFNFFGAKTKTNLNVTPKHLIGLLCFKNIHLQTIIIQVQNHYLVFLTHISSSNIIDCINMLHVSK